MEEKRMFERLEQVANVRYKIQGGKEEKDVILIKNVSGGGMRLFLYEKLNPGTNIDIEIHLPGDPESIPAEGKVVWVKEVKPAELQGEKRFETGIKFTKVDLIAIGRVAHVKYEE